MDTRAVLGVLERRKRPVLGIDPRFLGRRAGKCIRTDRRISFAKGKFGRGCQVRAVHLNACMYRCKHLTQFSTTAS